MVTRRRSHVVALGCDKGSEHGLQSEEVVPTAAGDGAWIRVLAVAWAVRLLLAPGYHSTDLEVHRNWLAVTRRSGGPGWWYHESTSPWTLDYPPLFAYFQWALGGVAECLCPAALQVSQQAPQTTRAWVGGRGGVNVVPLAPCTPAPSRPPTTQLSSSRVPLTQVVDEPCILVFHRASAVATELALVAAVAWMSGVVTRSDAWTTRLATILLHPALLLVDHMHFQYNGVLLAMLLVVIGCGYGVGGAAGVGTQVGEAACFVALAITFTVLVHLKHLFLVLGPVVAAYMLSWVGGGCGRGPQPPITKPRVWALVGGALGVMGTLLVAWLPVLVIDRPTNMSFMAQWRQVASRLFPFDRGLVHTYWAPNAWALYMAADRVAVAALCRGPEFLTRAALAWVPTLPCGAPASQTALTVLPTITPTMCAGITLALMAPLCWSLWRRPTPPRWHAALIVAYLLAFLYGWHVHEKALLYPVIPALLLPSQPLDGHPVPALSILAGVAQLPLIFTPLDVLPAAAIVVGGAVWQAANSQDRGATLAAAASVALTGLYLLQPWLLPHLPFLPLMVVSVVVGVGVWLISMAWWWRFVTGVV